MHFIVNKKKNISLFSFFQIHQSLKITYMANSWMSVCRCWRRRIDTGFSPFFAPILLHKAFCCRRLSVGPELIGFLLFDIRYWSIQFDDEETKSEQNQSTPSFMKTARMGRYSFMSRPSIVCWQLSGWTRLYCMLYSTGEKYPGAETDWMMDHSWPLGFHLSPIKRQDPWQDPRFSSFKSHHSFYLFRASRFISF